MTPLRAASLRLGFSVLECWFRCLVGPEACSPLTRCRAACFARSTPAQHGVELPGPLTRGFFSIKTVQGYMYFLFPRIPLFLFSGLPCCNNTVSNTYAKHINTLLSVSLPFDYELLSSYVLGGSNIICRFLWGSELPLSPALFRGPL